MIRSMTAFGRAKSEAEDKDITVEMKSVNSRFFDCSVKAPRAYAFLEERIKNYVQKNAVSRAKVDVFITVNEHGAKDGTVALDEALAAQYIAALKDLRDRFDLPDDITTMRVARNPDLFRTVRPDVDLEAEWERIRPVLDEAIGGYVNMRTAEGERTFRDLTAKIGRVRELSDEVEKISEEDSAGYREKIEARLRQVLADNRVTADENRILTECAIWADKIAIDEELVRLRSHFKAFFEIAGLAEPSGRKLDFLMQELNRETNTIGSKANNARIARLVVEMKGELEKIREQVQNIE